MNGKIRIISLIISLVLFSCGSEDALLSISGENGESSAYSGFHYQGQSCSQCHRIGIKSLSEDEFELEDGFEGGESEGEGKRFNIGGTIFKSLTAQDGDVNNAASGYYIVLKTNTGSYKVNIGRGAGNFYLNQTIYSTFIPLVYNNNGELMNSSSLPHQPSYTDCNSCHTSNGKNGAPGRIVSYNYYGRNSNNNSGTNSSNNANNNSNGNSTTNNNPPVISSFIANPSSGQPPLNVNFICSAYDTNGGISNYEFDFNSDGIVDATNTTGIVSYTYTTPGTYTAKCTAVDNQNNRTSKTININVGTNTGNTGNNNNTGGNNNTGNTTTLTFTNNILPIMQSAGCTGCHGWASSYSGVIQRINTQNPANSLILLKATATVSHGGGQRFTTSSQEYQTILNWIQQGANQ